MRPLRTIVCVDDYVSLLKTLALVLEDFGFKVLTSTNVQDAVIAVREHLPDAVLLEYTLCPGCPGTGECVAESIRAISPATKVVVWSTDDRPLRQPPPCAAASFMKPIGPVELAGRLQKALG